MQAGIISREMQAQVAELQVRRREAGRALISLDHVFRLLLLILPFQAYF